MKKIYLVWCMVAFAVVLSSLPVTGDPGGVSGVSGEISPDLPGSPVYPVILSEHKNQGVVRFWAGPGSPLPIIMYDQWTVIIPGSVNDTVKINISGSERYNRTLDRNVFYWSFDASSLDTVSVTVTINGTVYRFDRLTVRHEELSVSPAGSGGSSGKYDDWDLMVSNLKSGSGVFCSAILCIPIVGFLAWMVKNLKGVRQWK